MRWTAALIGWGLGVAAMLLSCSSSGELLIDRYAMQNAQELQGACKDLNIKTPESLKADSLLSNAQVLGAKKETASEGGLCVELATALFKLALSHDELVKNRQKNRTLETELQGQQQKVAQFEESIKRNEEVLRKYENALRKIEKANVR